MDRGKGGAIVMMSSLASLASITNQTVYSSTKAAMDQLARCLALELGPHKVIIKALQAWTAE